MICVEIMFMTFRQQTNLKHKIVFSQSCDLNYSTKWSRVSQQNYKVSFTGMPTTAVFFFLRKILKNFLEKNSGEWASRQKKKVKKKKKEQQDSAEEQERR